MRSNDPRESGWTPNKMLPDARHESFAQLRAAGTPVNECARIIGVSPRAAGEWKRGDTALQLAIQDRITHLRQTTARTIPSAIELFHRALTNAEAAAEAGQHKTAHDAYRWLYEERQHARFSAIETMGEPALPAGEDIDPADLLREGD